MLMLVGEQAAAGCGWLGVPLLGESEPVRPCLPSHTDSPGGYPEPRGAAGHYKSACLFLWQGSGVFLLCVTLEC